ncbi:MAG TPA: CGNR zinc finger domain-containing protein [Verrucomicrobiae bacterium]|nr:CGNR zinc finger domain-containing protein [Verrucomicrobiae bacterium]
MERAADKEAVSAGNFLFVGEHTALDFANTLLAANGAPFETLNSCHDLLHWLALARLISRAELNTLVDGLQSQAKQLSLLEQIRAFRGRWKTNLERLVAGKALSSDFIDLINRSLSGDLAWQVLTQEARTRTFHLHRQHVPMKPTGKILALIANEIAQFLASANLEYLRRCAGSDCVIYFYDTTKNHRRQWCSMAICGNRHKVASFRARIG